jgi:hypothetical protein
MLRINSIEVRDEATIPGVASFGRAQCCHDDFSGHLFRDLYWERSL